MFNVLFVIFSAKLKLNFIYRKKNLSFFSTSISFSVTINILNIFFVLHSACTTFTSKCEGRLRLGRKYE